ncbi:hypothetical protein E2R60_26325 [Paenibacillus dendritiformis]|uniref:hypothetical protein n=1 Tax=Paenibacillus dendritiformis TaxID=130049 RepID=UPI00105A696E|nr:hypothetical protein [Paenibacillus dendritiformis]TDL48900.1 hypothetical protein E2R60_26325 [Paenibacillus dendritiformis]
MKRKQDIRKHGERDEEVLKRLASKPITKVSRGRLLIRSRTGRSRRTGLHLSFTPRTAAASSLVAGGERVASASTRPDWKQARWQPLPERSRSGEKFVFK